MHAPQIAAELHCHRDILAMIETLQSALLAAILKHHHAVCSRIN
jgi:hypothetical protein